MFRGRGGITAQRAGINAPTSFTLPGGATAPSALPAPVEDGPLLRRALASVLERQARYEECLAVCGSPAARSVLVDRHKEGRERAEVRWVAPHVREEFLQLQGGPEGEALPLAGRSSSLRYLRASTSCGRLPTASILHSLMTEHLLEQEDPSVCLAAARYLHMFLFLQLGQQDR